MYCVDRFCYSAVARDKLLEPKELWVFPGVCCQFLPALLLFFLNLWPSQSSARVVEDGIPVVFEPAPSQISGPAAMTGRLPGATVGR
jgi:hypothetical protein